MKNLILIALMMSTVTAFAQIRELPGRPGRGGGIIGGLPGGPAQSYGRGGQQNGPPTRSDCAASGMVSAGLSTGSGHMNLSAAVAEIEATHAASAAASRQREYPDRLIAPPLCALLPYVTPKTHRPPSGRPILVRGFCARYWMPRVRSACGENMSGVAGYEKLYSGSWLSRPCTR